MKNKLIVLEGPDGTGKTTQARLLAEHYNAKLISQPSEDNCVGFIRKLAKFDKSFNSFERQLLIAQSHTVDAYTKFKGNGNIVMDRSYLSGFVYGELGNIPQEKIAVLSQILKNVYSDGLGDNWEVTILFFIPSQRLDKPDADIFESTIKWDDLKNVYERVYLDLQRKAWHAFSKGENIVRVETAPVNETFDRIVKGIDDFASGNI